MMKKILHSIFSLLLIAFLLTSCYVNDFSDIEQNGENENTELDVEKEVEQLQQRVEVFEKDITPLAQKCDSASQMLAYIEQIKAMPQVKDAWVENSVFCLKDESGMLHVWDFQDTRIISNEEMEEEVRQMTAHFKTRSADTTVGKGKRACILLSDDEEGLWSSFWGNLLKQLFVSYGFHVTIKNGESFTPEFLWNDDFLDYDVYYILTHGDYANGLHWIKTNADASALIILLMSKMGIKVKYGDLGYHYKRSGEIWSGRFMVSEAYFEDYVFNNRTFKRQSPIIFSAACLSMTGNNNFAKTFVDKGKAGAYIGFTTEQVHGRFAGIEFYRLMLENHYSVEGAIKALDNQKASYEMGKTINYQYAEKTNGNYYYETFLNKDLDCVIAKEGLYLNSPKAIDMGGKVKWSSCNIGADSEYELGDSLRWGEVRPWYSWLHSFDKGRYKRYDSGLHYDTDLDYNYVGVQIIDIGGLEKYDPATAYFGDGWRLPTKEDFEDLLYSGINKVETITETSPNYLLITNKVNGNQILLPYPDFEWTFSSFVCHYWTSESYKCIDENGNNEKEAWALLPVGIPPFYDFLMSDCPGYLAGFVRPVYTK
jgi:hypothetical protein